MIGASSHRQFAINVATSFGSLSLSLLLGIWYTPFMIRHLGVAAYGLVPLASSITNYLTIVTATVGTTVARFVVADLARSDAANANRHFNTFLVVGTTIAGGLFALSGVFGFTLLPLLFNIPSGQEKAAEYLFVAVAGSFLLSTITNIFESSVWVSNRFEIRSLIEAGTMTLRVGLIVLFFETWSATLWQVAVAIPCAGVFALMASVIACGKLAPSLRVRLADFDRTKLAELRYTSGWLLVSQIGNVLFLNMDLVLANVLLGPEAGGYYAPLVQWGALLRTVAMIVAGVLGPPIIVFYTRRETGSLLRVSGQAAKFLGLLTALPVGLLCGFAKPLLETWLGRSFVSYAPLAWFLLLPLPLEAGQMHSGSVIIAANRLRGPGLFSLLSGFGYVSLAMVLTRHFQLGLYGIALAGAAASLARSVYFSTYAAAVMEGSRKGFLSILGGALLAALTVAATAAIASVWLAPGSWIRLGLFAAPLGAAYLAVVYFLVLNDEDRTRLRNIVLLRGAAEPAPARSSSS